MSECSSELEGVAVVLREYPVRRVTPAGVWIFDPRTYEEKWVSLQTRKAFAYASKEDALNSFKIRNARHIQYLERDLERAKLAREALITPDLYKGKEYDLALINF